MTNYCVRNETIGKNYVHAHILVAFSPTTLEMYEYDVIMAMLAPLLLPSSMSNFFFQL